MATGEIHRENVPIGQHCCESTKMHTVYKLAADGLWGWAGSTTV